MNKIKRHCEIQTFSRSLNNKVHGNGTFGFKKNEKLNLTNEPKTQEITLDLEIIFLLVTTPMMEVKEKVW
jgi:hypothetical protein